MGGGSLIWSRLPSTKEKLSTSPVHPCTHTRCRRGVCLPSNQGGEENLVLATEKFKLLNSETGFPLPEAQHPYLQKLLVRVLESNIDDFKKKYHGTYTPPQLDGREVD